MEAILFGNKKFVEFYIDEEDGSRNTVSSIDEDGMTPIY